MSQRYIDKKQLIGSWCGSDEGNLQSFLVRLDADGGGAMAVCYLDNEPKLYGVDRWMLDLDDATLSIETTPDDPVHDKLFLQGFYSGRSLDMVVSGSEGGGWKRKLRLIRCDEWRRRLERLVEASRDRKQPVSPGARP